MPKVTLEIATARFTFVLHRALNKKPRKITSSKKPTHSILTTYSTLSAGV